MVFENMLCRASFSDAPRGTGLGQSLSKSHHFSIAQNHKGIPYQASRYDVEHSTSCSNVASLGIAPIHFAGTQLMQVGRLCFFVRDRLSWAMRANSGANSTRLGRHRRIQARIRPANWADWANSVDQLRAGDERHPIFSTCHRESDPPPNTQWRTLGHGRGFVAGQSWG